MRSFHINGKKYWLTGTHLQIFRPLDFPAFVGTIDQAKPGFFITVGDHEEFIIGKKNAVQRMANLYEQQQLAKAAIQGSL